jgi:hypothetical protein
VKAPMPAHTLLDRETLEEEEADAAVGKC